MISPVYDRHGVTVLSGDCLDVLATLPDQSVDAVVTDPPYGLGDHRPAQVVDAVTAWAAGDRARVPDGRGFMGRAWDAFVPPPAVFDACFRVLRPGGHLLVFAGTRTVGLMDLSARLAGFEVRDTIGLAAWTYGSGYPKGIDVAKAIDRKRHDRDEILEVTAWIRAARDRAGLTNRQVDDAFGFAGMANHWTTDKTQPAVPTLDQVPALLGVLGVAEDEVPARVAALLLVLNGRKGTPGAGWSLRAQVATGHRVRREGSDADFAGGSAGEYAITAAGSELARRWEGWNTSLKPAWEPLLVCRRPMVGTVADNVAAHGVGALNVAACRVAHRDDDDRAESEQKNAHARFGSDPGRNNVYGDYSATPVRDYDGSGGRWPTNAVLTHHPDCGDDDQPGPCVPGCHVADLDDAGAGASRFFPVFRWEAKAPAHERPQVDGRGHPTVKPLALMRWLVRLVCPPGGTVLDPFAGSGTTGHAARAEGMAAVLIEREPDYLPLIRARLEGRPRTTTTAAVPAQSGPVDLLDLLDGGAADA